MELSIKEKNLISKEMKKPILTINEFAGLTENYIVNLPSLVYLSNKEWILKYSDINSVKFKIYPRLCNSLVNNIKFLKTIVLIDSDNQKYKLIIGESKAPFFYYDDVELMKEIIEILKSKNKTIEVKDYKLKRLEHKNLNSVYKHLSWDNEKEDIENYINKNLSNIDIENFLQPSNSKYDKNVWEGCALVIDKQSDEKLESYIDKLLEWLQDANWPGFNIILERLKRMNLNILIYPLNQTIEKANKEKNEMWLYWLTLLLENQEIKKKISKENLAILLNNKEKIDNY